MPARLLGQDVNAIGNSSRLRSGKAFPGQSLAGGSQLVADALLRVQKSVEMGIESPARREPAVVRAATAPTAL